MRKRVKIELTSEQRNELEKFTTKGCRNVHLVTRAKIILALDTSSDRRAATQESIAKVMGVSRQAVIDARNAFVLAQSTKEFLQRKKRDKPPVEAKITGEVEAHIIALACSEVPKGCAKWTLRLLAEKMVELQYIDKLSHMSVSRVLKKHNLSLI